MKKEEQALADGKVPSPETQPQTPDNPVKRCGHPTAKNEWFDVGFSPVEIAMLKNIQASIWIELENSTRAATIRVLLLAALAHYDTLARVLFGDADYCEKEGFTDYNAYFGQMIEGQVARSGAALAAIKKARLSRPAGKGGGK